jgi:hypothetical protein
MDIKDHGDWRRYKPAQLPKDAPANTMFSRRTSDHADWYDYVNSGTNFAISSIKLTLRAGNIVGAAVTDPTLLFPGDGSVLEVFDYAGSDPQADFGMKIYDPAARTFHDPPSPIMESPTMTELMERIAALEAKLGGA